MNTQIPTYNDKLISIEDIYSLLLNYKGYGNPKGKYWFIGMEEHLGLEEKQNPLIGWKQTDVEYYSKKIVPFDEIKDRFYNDAKRKGNNFERGIISLLQKLEGQKCQDIIENEIFITNSRFAPFQRLKDMNQVFGKSKSEYLKDDFTYKSKISQLWLSSRPYITFCLSKTYTNDFNSLFQMIVTDFEFVDSNNSGLFFRDFKYQESFIYQINHPRKFSSQYLIDISDKMKQYSQR